MKKNLRIIVLVARAKDGKLVIAADGRQIMFDKSDLAYFKTITSGHTLIVGRTTGTVELRSKLQSNGRSVIVLSRNRKLGISFDKCISIVDANPERVFFVIGGGEIYSLFKDLASEIYLTDVGVTDVERECKYFESLTQNYKLVSVAGSGPHFLKYKWSGTSGERAYLDLAQTIVNQGISKVNRTDVGTLSVFGGTLEFDISTTVPLLTTKRVAYRACIEELLWFLRGETDSKILEKRGVNIWKGNTTRNFLDNRGLTHYPDGVLGPGYGWNWRHFGSTYNVVLSAARFCGGVDQITNVIESIKSDPFSRRHYVSAWNPIDVDQVALPPCHVAFQFNVRPGSGGRPEFLDIRFDMRSTDVFCGLPFNLFSYSVLCYIVAAKTGLNPGKLVFTGGDIHVYESHKCQMELQCSRNPRPFPMLLLNDAVKSVPFESLSVSDFEIVGYFPHPSIKGKMVI